MVWRLWYLFCNWETKFKITDTQIYVPVVTLAIQDNEKLLQQLKSDFKRKIDTYKNIKQKKSTEGQNQVFHFKSKFLIDTSFQGVNRLFVLSLENEGDRKVHTEYHLPKVEIKDYNVMIDGKKFFDQPVKNGIRTYNNIRKISTDQEDDYTTDCLLDYNYVKEHYKMIAIDLSKQQELGSDQYNKLILLEI